MKNLSMLLVAALFAGWLTGCQKADISPATTTADNALTTKVNEWLDLADQSITRPEGKERFRQLRSHLHIDQLHHERFNDNTDMLIIPVDDAFVPKRNEADHPLHILMIKISSSGQIMSGHLAQYIPLDGQPPAAVPTGVFEHYFNNESLLPDCRIVFMTNTGNFINESTFRSGKKAEFKAIHSPDYTNPTDDECIEWYLQTFVNGILVYEEYLFTTCGPYVEEGTPGSGEEEPEATRDVIWEVAHNPVPGVPGSIMSMEVIKGRRNNSYPNGGYFTRIFHHSSDCNFCHTYEPYNVWTPEDSQVSYTTQTASAYIIGDLHFNYVTYSDLNNSKQWIFNQVFN